MADGRRLDRRADAARLYDAFGASLYRYALMVLADPAAAEDVVQQVFTAVLHGARPLEDPERYLRRAVRNECYTVLRQRARSGPLAADLPRRDREGDHRDEPEPALLVTHASGASPEERLALERAIRALPAEQREVLHLHAFEGMTFQEIADASGASINTVAARYRYALDKLRKSLA
jgi:RNA polymerase sigma-70 factor, ECF subfamily